MSDPDSENIMDLLKINMAKIEQQVKEANTFNYKAITHIIGQTDKFTQSGPIEMSCYGISRDKFVQSIPSHVQVCLPINKSSIFYKKLQHLDTIFGSDEFIDLNFPKGKTYKYVPLLKHFDVDLEKQCEDQLLDEHAKQICYRMFQEQKSLSAEEKEMMESLRHEKPRKQLPPKPPMLKAYINYRTEPIDESGQLTYIKNPYCSCTFPCRTIPTMYQFYNTETKHEVKEAPRSLIDKYLEFNSRVIIKLAFTHIYFQEKNNIVSYGIVPDIILIVFDKTQYDHLVARRESFKFSLDNTY